VEVQLLEFLSAAVRIAIPLLFAALGELLAERGGVINLGIEGMMLCGALAAAVGSSVGGPWVGLGAGAAAGALVAGVFAAVAIGARADQIITGTAITLGAVGLTGALYRVAFGAEGPGLSLPTFVPALFGQPATTWIALGLVPVCWWLLFRTRAGLSLRAVGEAPDRARAMGAPVRRLQVLATLAGGVMAGAGGATLVLAQVGTFSERMTAGRGFIAIAIVVLGRWHPVGVLGAALLFGAATALQFGLQALGLEVPYQLFLMLPYLLTLALLAGLVGRTRAPAALGRVAG
jgi:simple sugar transport system permease protein